jgi:para-aminobenzoate synthetase component I
MHRLNRKFISFPIADPQQTKRQMLNWCNQFNICCFLDNHNYHLSHHTVECLAAAGTIDSVSCSSGNALETLSAFSDKCNDFLFGHFAYDLKNEIEQLHSSRPDGIGFPDLFFFVPRVVLKLNKESLSIGCVDGQHKSIWEQINNSIDTAETRGSSSVVRSRYTKEKYIQTVEQLKQHILRGDCYEINFCQEFFAEQAEVDPLHLYQQLSSSSPNPFSAYYRINERFISCLSPERFLKKEGSRILSQPIKGTAQRDGDPATDDENARLLLNSEKERAENIMIVDLVRNDLSRICETGSVKVEELCAVYSFPQVHQMISTVSGTIKKDTRWTDAVRATFPMGSMTGAPKKRVMELIEQYELSKRGLFSGSIGYVTPEGDFDFNVVIRSVLYNRSAKYLSFHTGSAITFKSNPEREYEECLLKAAAIKKALAEANTFH